MGRRTGARPPRPTHHLPDPLTHHVLSSPLPANRAEVTTELGLGGVSQIVDWDTERWRATIHVRAVPIISINPNTALPKLTPP